MCVTMPSLGAVGKQLSGAEKQTLGQVPCPVIREWSIDEFSGVVVWTEFIFVFKCPLEPKM